MLHSLKQFGSGARAAVNVVTSALPIAIIGGLLYAGFFVKAEAVINKVEPKAVERRDNFFSVVAPDAQIAWAAGTGGKIVRSDDGGRTWHRQDSTTLENLQGIAAWDAQHAVVAGNHGVVLYTSDGGSTWKHAQVPKSDNPNKLFRVHIFDGVAWAVGEFGSLLRSDDKGATWTRAMEEKDRAWNDVFFRGRLGWLVGEFGTVMRSTDGGATWSETALDNKVSLMGVDFRDDLNGVAVGLTGTVLVTSDGGQTWREVARPTREHLLDIAWDEKRWVAVGDKGVMVTSDAAANEWKAARISEGDVSWRTQITRAGDRHYVAGANLAVLDGGTLTIVGR
ncbi:WD40/YVTN/BNR-like repeat-containing protein [Methyloversatilis thermotolerans]|uniref:WD40/YVTN/BNR-like repeat-containing protein n=1 Tax=Methyloversatilis thermotolerans TaxID=1346290 RepID=UPI0004778423|nr:YCF48-related protein [Methyloversatilis thermotolerans]